MDSAVEIQVAAEADDVPRPAQLRAWADAALAAVGHAGAGVTLRVVDADEGRSLNREFRGRDYATNVLSFPFPELPPEATAELGGRYLGDVAVCADVAAREAVEQGKTAEAHWAHLVVHGVLHLAGFDHHDDAQAAAMEARERAILAALGYPDPYAAEAASSEVPDHEPDG